MLTKHTRTCLVFAAGGAISTATARALHRSGVEVALAARNPDALTDLHRELGCSVPVQRVDVLDPMQVDAAFATVQQHLGSVDAVFNGVGPRAADAGYGTTLADLSLDSFTDLHRLVVGGQFVTARAAARHWTSVGQAGTVLTLSSSLSRLKMSGMAGLASASAAIEGLTRAIAAELAPLGGRAICINATAMPETRTINETNALQAKRLGILPAALMAGMQQGYLLGRGPSLEELGDLIAFAASPAGAILNGHVIDADRGATSVL